MQAKLSSARYCIASMQSTGINFIVYVQGTFTPMNISLRKEEGSYGTH